jgi:hypothetical protein
MIMFFFYKKGINYIKQSGKGSNMTQMFGPVPLSLSLSHQLPFFGKFAPEVR